MRPLKAVIIDDDPTELVILKRILQRRGHKVLAYDNPLDSPLHKCGKCPCSLHDSNCPDLIISDVHMPVMNGVDLLESVMSKGCHCRHLALISGHGLANSDLLRVAKYGTRYFLKPLDLDDFYPWLDKVEQHIHNSHT